MAEVRYDASPPVLRNNPLVFVVSVIAIAVAVALISEAPELIVLVAAVLVLAWFVLFLFSKYHRLTITDREVHYVYGLLSKTRTELGLTSIRSIRVDQSFFQRILGIGDIEFYTAGDNPEIRVKGMPSPHLIRELVDG